MRFVTPWSSGGQVWSDVVGKASFPGADGKCSFPALAIPPVVHRFEHVVLLPGDVLPLPALDAWSLSGDSRPNSKIAEMFAALSEALGMPSSAPAIRAEVRPWQLTKAEWACQVAIEQAWQALGVTLGEPIGAVPLAPGEELSVEIFTWNRSRTSTDSETSEIVDRQTSVQATTHDSYQVTRRLQSEFKWGIEGGTQKSPGSAAGKATMFRAEGSVQRVVERQFQHTRELTRKVAEQIRSEHKVRVSTVSESGREEKRTQKLRNQNPCHSVTYQFYEQLHHYRVRHAPAELQYVVLAPNSLPALTPEWVTCHEGVLRTALLDDSMADGLSAARELSRQRGEGQLVVAARKLAISLTPRVSEPQESSGGGGFWSWVGGAAMAAFKAVSSLLQPGDTEDRGESLLLALGKSPSLLSLKAFLWAHVEEPSVPGLAAAVAAISAYYRGEEAPEAMQDALGYAVGVLSAAGLRAVPGTSDREDALSAGAGEAVRAVLDTRRISWAAFDRFACHIEDNLLHYMRAIWLAEDPAQRWARFASQTLAGEAFWDLAENRLVGFHLNASVFPVQLGSDLEKKLEDLVAAEELMAVPQLPLPAGLVDMQGRSNGRAKALQSRVAETSRRVVMARAPQPVALALAAVQKAASAEAPVAAGDDSLEQAKALLARAGEHLDAFRPQPLLAERTLIAGLRKSLEQMEHARVADETVQSHLKEFVVSARRLKGGAPIEDLLVALPSTDAHLEVLTGGCSGCGTVAERELEARVGQLEADRRIREAEATRRQRRLDAGDLSPEPEAQIPVAIELSKKEP